MQQRTKLQVSNALALPTLLYGDENWTIKASDKTELQTLQSNSRELNIGYFAQIITETKAYQKH